MEENEEFIEEEITPAIFLRKVDVIIQNEGEEPIVIEAPKPEKEEDESVEENQEQEE